MREQGLARDAKHIGGARAPFWMAHTVVRVDGRPQVARVDGHPHSDTGGKFSGGNKSPFKFLFID